MKRSHVTNSAAQHECRQGTSCLLLFCAKCGACLFSALSLANPAVENHSMMSIQQELFPDEASLASGSWTPILIDRKSPEGTADTPRHPRPVLPWLAPLTVPVTSPAHFTDTERSFNGGSETRSTNCEVLVLHGSVAAPVPPSCCPVSSSPWNM